MRVLDILADRLYQFLESHKDSLNRSAGMLILAAIAMSVNIGIFPSILLGSAGFLMLIASLIEDSSFDSTMRSISIAIILASPSISIVFGRDYKNFALFMAAPLILAAIIHRSSE